MDARIITEYRKNRAKYPHLSAKYALATARLEPIESQYPDIDWSGDWWDDTFTGTHDGATITVRITADEYNEPDGSFTDRYRDGMIQNPDYRPNLYGYENVMRWYEPLVSVRENWRENRRTMGRHEAYTTAVRWAREECKADQEPERYIITVRADIDGSVGEDTLHGVNGDRNDFEGTRKAIFAEVSGMIGIAVREAREAAETARRQATVYRVSVADLETIAGRALTAEEVATIERAIGHSSIGDALVEVVHAVTGSLADEGEDDRTWTFLGHWEAGEIVIEHTVEGEHEDVREDNGYWDEGLFAASGTGATVEDAEAAMRAEYERDEDTD